MPPPEDLTRVALADALAEPIGIALDLLASEVGSHASKIAPSNNI